MTREEKAAKIFAHYGFRAQLKKLDEELGELECEVSDMLYGDLSEERMIKFTQELADVQVMILQWRDIVNREEFEGTIDFKLDRTLERMK